jgi:pilus assembly protein Flp/PilA
MNLIRRFVMDNCAATAIEYALVAGLVSIAIVAGARAVGVALQNKFYGPLASGLS